jgi:hypothetical protein
VIHDISGRRAAVVAACALEYTGYYPKETSLRATATEMGRAGDALVASQIRYFEYFCISRRLNTIYKPDKQLRLERVIVNGVPDFSNDSKLAANQDAAFCVPYVRIIDSAGKELDASLPPSKAVYGTENFFGMTPTNRRLILQGDIMLRFFHHKQKDPDVAMFAISFHVGFVTDVVLRFTIAEIDGTSKNPRFPRDMFIDVIFSEHIDQSDMASELPVQTEVGERPYVEESIDIGEEDFTKSALMRELEALEDESLVDAAGDEELQGFESNSSTPGATVVFVTNPSPVESPDADNQLETTHSEVTETVSTRGSEVEHSEGSALIAKRENESKDIFEVQHQNPIVGKYLNEKTILGEQSAVSLELLMSPLKKDIVPPSPITMERGDSVLKEIEAALEEDEDFAVDDFDLSELEDS